MSRTLSATGTFLNKTKQLPLTLKMNQNVANFGARIQHINKQTKTINVIKLFRDLQLTCVN